MRRLSTTAALLAVLLAALGVRVAGGIWWQSRHPDGFGFGDSLSYWTLGQAIALGEPFQYNTPDASVFRTPGYPLALAAMFKVLGTDASKLSGHVVSALLGMLTVGEVFWLGKWLFDARTGLVAACLAAFYPGVVAMGVFILSEAPFCPLMLAHLGLWGFAWQQSAGQSSAGWRSLAWAAIAGIAAGGATLMRPSWLLFTPFAIAAALIFARMRMKQLLIGAAVMAGMCLTLIPWWIRNARVTGHFVPTTLQVGASLYDGLNPNASGASEMSFVPRFVEQERRNGAAQDFEYRLDRRLRDAALAWAAEHRGRAIELARVKFLRMWNIWPNEVEFRSWPLRLAVLTTYLPVLGLSVWGVWRFTNRGWPYVLCWLPAVYLTLLHVVFVSSIRYRDPAILALLVLAAGIITQQGSTRSSVV